MKTVLMLRGKSDLLLWGPSIAVIQIWRTANMEMYKIVKLGMIFIAPFFSTIQVNVLKFLINSFKDRPSGNVIGSSNGMS